MTNSIPFADKRATAIVLMLVLKGEHPARPRDAEVVERGLDDSLWGLLESCWAFNPDDRPSMDEVLAELPQV